ncbi:MAG: hypothetical protein V1798_08085, partial [Pseudomonadota bacterium]
MQAFTKCASGLLMAGVCMGLLYCHSNPEEEALVQTRQLDALLLQSGEQKLVAGGDGHSVAAVNNAVYAWGKNNRGQLGNNSTTASNLPVPVATPAPTPFNGTLVAVEASGLASYAVTDTGQLFAWGSNEYGQLGVGGTSCSPYCTVPQPVAGIPGGVAAISSRYHSVVALDTGGNVWTWGLDDSNQLGYATPAPVTCGGHSCQTTPVKLDNPTNVVAVSAGKSHSMALDDQGRIWSWGANDCGQLGFSTTDTTCSLPSVTPIPCQSIPKQVSGLGIIQAVAAGGSHSMALDASQNVYSWGDNQYGQLGLGTANLNQATPTVISSLTGVISVAAGGYHSMAIQGTDHSAWTWGSNSDPANPSPVVGQ